MSNLQRKFIDTYARTGGVRAAAKSAKISLASHYRALETSEPYRTAFRAAQQQLADRLEEEAFRRALHGSDELLPFLLRAWLPDRYREHAVWELSGTVALSDSEASAARAGLFLVKQEQVQ
jgi:hypothetical protein